MADGNRWIADYYQYCHPGHPYHLYCNGYPSCGASRHIPEYAVTSLTGIPLHVTDGTLVVPSFKIHRRGQHYINPQPLYIDLRRLAADSYRIIVVHNFQADDHNPNLDECLAGIVLTRKVGQRWQEAEDRPLECRTIAQVGVIEIPSMRLLEPC